MRRLLLAAIAILGLAALPATALAFSAKSGNNVTLPKSETVTGTYYVAGQNVTIDGTVDGDIIFAGHTVTINGAVHGDVIGAGQSVTINGPVDGSVRVAGQTVNINGPVARNATVAGQSVSLSGAAKVAGDLGALGQAVTVDGTVERDVYGAMQSLTIGAGVGAVTVTASNISLTSGAEVHGDVHYTSADAQAIDSSKVTGQIVHSTPPPAAHQPSPAARAGAMIGFLIYAILAGMLTGLVLAWLAPRMVGRVTDTMTTRPGATLGWGLLVTLLTPILAILLMVTLVALPLGLLLLAIWTLFILTSSLFSGIAAGRWLLGRLNWQSRSLVWAAAIGIPVLYLLFALPLLGALVAMVSVWWAVGGFALNARRLR